MNAFPWFIDNPTYSTLNTSRHDYISISKACWGPIIIKRKVSMFEKCLPSYDVDVSWFSAHYWAVGSPSFWRTTQTWTFCFSARKYISLDTGSRADPPHLPEWCTHPPRMCPQEEEHALVSAFNSPMKTLLQREPLGLGPAIRLDHEAQRVRNASAKWYRYYMARVLHSIKMSHSKIACSRHTMHKFKIQEEFSPLSVILPLGRCWRLD